MSSETLDQRMLSHPIAECGTASPQEESEVEVRIVEATSGWRAVDFRELWRYRELLYFMVWRDVKVRYKQTVLGAAWALLQPLMTMVVFTIFFGGFGGMAKNVEGDYALFVFAALLPWQFFATAVGQSGQSLVNSAGLISKVYFPRLIVPISSLGSGLVDFAISLALMLVLMLLRGTTPRPEILLVPVFLLGTVMTAIGVGTLLSALVVAYRDFRHVIPFLVQIWMFASPVAYPLHVVPEKFRLIYALNPMAGMIGGFRYALLGTPLPVSCLAVSSCAALVALIVGLVYFCRVENRFADIV